MIFLPVIFFPVLTLYYSDSSTNGLKFNYGCGIRTSSERLHEPASIVRLFTASLRED
jgi:hypothetical protein